MEKTANTIGEWTKGPWAWQKFGNYFMLVAQHGLRDIIIGSLPVERKPIQTYPATNIDGILRPITPDNPNAQLIASAPQLKAENEALKETIREILALKKELGQSQIYIDSILEIAQKALNPKP